MEYTSQYVVFIGRFEPFHIGHRAIVEEALVKGEHVIVLIGSSFRHRSPKNPWTAREREEMIRSSFSSDDNLRLSFSYLEDRYNSALWAEDAKAAVKSIVEGRGDVYANSSVRIIGREKDGSSYYLNIFPEWSPVLEIHSCDSLSATELRDFLFFGGNGGLSLIKANVPFSVYEILKTFQEYSLAFDSLKKDAAISRSEKFKNKDHILNMMSLVLKKNNKLFLTKRQELPGLGLLNLPNTLMSDDVDFIQMVAEIFSKMDVKVTLETLKKSIKKTHVFDEVDRSEYGRILNHAILIDLKELENFETSNGHWFDFNQLEKLKEHLFEDDYRTIRHFL